MAKRDYKTEFERWRRQMGLTQEEAGVLLGVSASQVKNWERGVERGTARRSAPSEVTRRIMTAIVLGNVPPAWPE